VCTRAKPIQIRRQWRLHNVRSMISGILRYCVLERNAGLLIVYTFFHSLSGARVIFKVIMLFVRQLDLPAVTNSARNLSKLPNCLSIKAATLPVATPPPLGFMQSQ
jgi:hypothetical protein